MKRVFFIFIVLLAGLGTTAQSFVLDSAFQPFFDIRSQRNVRINDLLELTSGNILLSGNFRFGTPGQVHDDMTSTQRNGQQNSNYIGTNGGNGVLLYISDSSLISGGGSYLQIDTNGFNINPAWRLNYLKTLQCGSGIPYFFPDGSSIFASSIPCPIINPPDTFPGRYLLKLDPLGFWDSTFTGIASLNPNEIIRYDSTRLLIMGSPSGFTHYNGVAIKGFCRIFLDGTLDTTFHSPLKDTSAHSAFTVSEIAADGSFLIHGVFWLENQNIRQTLCKLNSDGSLDPNFRNFDGPRDTALAPIYVGGVNSVVKTNDGGYLVGGGFNNYQGQFKRNLAKIDSVGNLEPQYFTGLGPDSSESWGNLISSVNVILKSKFGGYYIGGDFLKWDGQASQPIVRITDLNYSVGIHESPFDFAQGASLAIYPNPTTGKFQISAVNKIKDVSVFGIEGKLLDTKRSTENSQTFNLPNKNGLYLIQVTLENGAVITKKVVKQ